MAERLLRVFHHGIEAYQVHLCPGDEVIANGTDIGVVQPEEKSPFTTTAATAEAVRGVKLGAETGIAIQTVDKRGRKTASKAPAKRKTTRKTTRKAGAKAPARKKTSARKKTAARKTTAKA